jgi:hypothetical protein
MLGAAYGRPSSEEERRCPDPEVLCCLVRLRCLERRYKPLRRLATANYQPATQFFDNPDSPFLACRVLANPDLGPERSCAVQGGIRPDDARASGQITAATGRCWNRISREIVAGKGIPSDPFVCRFVNPEAARIIGWEARAGVGLGRSFTLTGCLARARGG